MATLSEIRTAIKATLAANLSGVFLYELIPDDANIPAVVIMPQEGEFDGSFGRGMDTWTFDLIVLVSRVSPEVSQAALDPYLSGGGSLSIRNIFDANESLGLSDGTIVDLTGMRGYGGSFDSANLKYIGAILRLVVRTPSS